MRPFRHVVLRAFLALLAILTAAAPAAASVGEGVLASRAGHSPVVVHVEDARRPGCPYVHADDCALCAVLAAHALPRAAEHAGAPRLSVRAPREAADVGTWFGRERHASHDARGPPTG